MVAARPARRKAKAHDESLDVLLADVEADAARRLVTAAISSFATRGYHATSTRDISVGAGLSPAALYVHFESKEHLLYFGSKIAHESAHASVSTPAAPTSDHVARLREFVYDFTLWHAKHQILARVAQYSLNELSPDHFAEIAGIRRGTAQLLSSDIQRGVKAKVFRTTDVAASALAILSMGIDVARWFRPDLRITPTSLAEMYARLALNMVQAPG